MFIKLCPFLLNSFCAFCYFYFHNCNCKTFYCTFCWRKDSWQELKPSVCWLEQVNSPKLFPYLSGKYVEQNKHACKTRHACILTACTYRYVFQLTNICKTYFPNRKSTSRHLIIKNNLPIFTK